MHQFEHYEFTGTRTLSLVVVAGTLLRLQTGRLWLTMQGNADDIWLNAGDEWQALRASRLHLSAEPQATFALGRPVTGHWAKQRTEPKPLRSLLPVRLAAVATAWR